MENSPYWQVNVTLEGRTSECPEFLLHIHDRDKRSLATRDAEYHILTWYEVQELIKTGRLDAFRRIPSELRRYMEYMFNLKKQYGSVMKFVLQERLQWEDLKPSAGPFQDPGDFKILRNDWPYGIDPTIVHLVVWTKFELIEDPVTERLTATARQEIQDFVGRTFVSKLSSERVIWFRNWKSLKSIHSVEHFHVMLLNPSSAVVKELVGGVSLPTENSSEM